MGVGVSPVVLDAAQGFGGVSVEDVSSAARLLCAYIAQSSSAVECAQEFGEFAGFDVASEGSALSTADLPDLLVDVDVSLDGSVMHGCPLG
jgi:hypothetical protein